MFTFRTIVLWIHVAAIIVWVGGMIVVPFVVAPAVRRLTGERGEEVAEALVRRFQRLSRELVFAVLLTGIFNLINAGWFTNFAYSPRYAGMVATKFMLFVAMAINQAWYSLALVPGRKHRLAVWSALANVALAAVALYLGVSLR